MKMIQIISRSLIGFAIFVFVFVVKHGEVRLITTLGDVVVFDGLQDSTTWLMGVGAVGETALFRELKNLLEITRQFLALHIKGAEALDTWGVNKK